MFPGQWFQGESGLHQRGMRDYDPVTGSYLQPDPLGLVDGPAVYAYAKGAPGVYVDPYGLQRKGRNDPGRRSATSQPRGGIAYGVFVYFRGIYRCGLYCDPDSTDLIVMTLDIIAQHRGLQECLLGIYWDYVKGNPGTTFGRVGTGVGISAGTNPIIGGNSSVISLLGDMSYATSIDGATNIASNIAANVITAGMTGDIDLAVHNRICKCIESFRDEIF